MTYKDNSPATGQVTGECKNIEDPRKSKHNVTNTVFSVKINTKLIESHCTIIHKVASLYKGEGKLILASFGQIPISGKNLPPIVTHFNIGEHDKMAEHVSRLTQDRHRNVYASLVIVRPDLPERSKGGVKDVVAVFGLVADYDDDAAPMWKSRCPMSPTFVLETSKDRYQAFFLFENPIPPDEAKSIAKELKTYCNCDHGTADISHVWRIAGTLNWPNKKKAQEGRSETPQLVRVEYVGN